MKIIGQTIHKVSVRHFCIVALYLCERAGLQPEFSEVIFTINDSKVDFVLNANFEHVCVATPCFCGGDFYHGCMIAIDVDFIHEANFDMCVYLPSF